MNKYSPDKTVKVPVTKPKDQAMLKDRTKEKPSYKVGKVIHSGSTRIGSFPKDK